MTRRYCGPCDTWVRGTECPACGADTDAPVRPPRRRTTVVGPVATVDLSPPPGAPDDWRADPIVRRLVVDAAARIVTAHASGPECFLAAVQAYEELMRGVGAMAQADPSPSPSPIAVKSGTPT